MILLCNTIYLYNYQKCLQLLSILCLLIITFILLALFAYLNGCNVVLLFLTQAFFYF